MSTGPAEPPCGDGAGRCVEGAHQACIDGAWQASPCPPELPLCSTGQCVACAGGESRCATPDEGSSTSTKREQCAADGSAWETIETCAAGEVCLQGACAPCVPGSVRCEGGVRQVCDAAGPTWLDDPCPTDKPVCDQGTCYGCIPDTTFCAPPLPGQTTPTVVLTCDAAGVDTIADETCPPPLACYAGACRICLPGETRCADGATLQTCAKDGQGWVDSPCPPGAKVCAGGACRFCQPGQAFCPPVSPGLQPSQKVLQCNASGTKAVVSQVCGEGEVCSGGQCGSCAPKQTICIGNAALSCSPDGKAWQGLSLCAATATTCAKGSCSCTPLASGCAAPPLGLTVSNQVATCNDAGTAAVPTDSCGPLGACSAGTCLACVAGSMRCQGDKQLVCKADGSGWQAGEDCAASSLSCSGGQCIDLCNPKTANPGHLGCQFTAASLPDSVATSGSSVTLWFSNPGDAAAQVTVTLVGGSEPPPTTQLEVPAQSSKSLALPADGWSLPPPAEPWAIRLYRVLSSRPLTVSQARSSASTPAGTVASGESSLLWPDNALGTSYRAIQQPLLHAKSATWLALANPSAVVAKLSVATPCAATLWPAGKLLKAGETVQTELPPGSSAVLTAEALLADLSGARVDSSAPLAAWAGAVANAAPNTLQCIGAETSPAGVGTCALGGAVCSEGLDCPQACCGDHQQEQLWPVSRWSTVHIVPALAPRSKSAEAGVVRVVADQAATVVATVPPLGPPETLAAGQWREFVTAGDVAVVASKPVAVMQWMASAQYLQAPTPPPGDPMMQWVAPVASGRTTLAFAVPAGWIKHHVAIAAPTDAAPALDGNPLGDGLALSGSGWSIWRVAVSSGHHQLTALRPMTAHLYGWADGVAHGRVLGGAAP